MACQVLSSVRFRAFYLPKISFWRFGIQSESSLNSGGSCAPHVGQRDGNPTVGISPVFTGVKNRAVTLIGGINTHSN